MISDQNKIMMNLADRIAKRQKIGNAATEKRGNKEKMIYLNPT